MKTVCRLMLLPVLLCFVQAAWANNIKDIVTVNKEKDEVCATFKARDGKTYTKCHGFRNTPATSERKALLEPYFKECYRNNAWFGKGSSLSLLPGQDSLYAGWICPDKRPPKPGQECGEIWDYKKRGWVKDPGCKKPKPPQPGDDKPANPTTNPTPCGYMHNGQWIPLPCTNPDKPHHIPPGDGNGTGGGSNGSGSGSGSGDGTGNNGDSNGNGANGDGNGNTEYIPPNKPPKPNTNPPTKNTHMRIAVSQWGQSGGSYTQHYLLPLSCANTTTFGQKSNCDWRYKVKICGADMTLPQDTSGYCYNWTSVSTVNDDDFADTDVTIDTDSKGNVTINNITINNNNYGNNASSQPADSDDDGLPSLDKGKITPGRNISGSSGGGLNNGNNGADGNSHDNATGTGTAGSTTGGSSTGTSASDGAAGSIAPNGNCTPGTVGCAQMGGMGDVDAAINGNRDIGGGIADGIGRHDVDIGQVGKAAYFVEQGSCPPPRRFTFMGTTHEISYQPLCDIAVKIRPFVIFCGLFLAFGIVRAALVRQ